MVQLSPKDPQSSLEGNMPEKSTASFNRAIFDANNDASIKSLINAINDATGGSKYLLAYLIYHELNISSKYADWLSAVGASGIENFMNQVADAIHTSIDPGKLIAHTGDSKDVSNDIYKAVESIDTISGNVFAKFDLLGFNLYISTDAMLNEDQYYQRIVERRAFSVNASRGWCIGETGASYDSEADPSKVAAANYTNAQGGANLQIMWQKTKALGNMIGFVLFTVQDNDLGEDIGNSMKQRGFFDAYATKKFLYYVYPDVINEISSNERCHSTNEHKIAVKITEQTDSFIIHFEFENKSSTAKSYLYTVHSDAGYGKQRFSVEEAKAYLTLAPDADTTIIKSFIIKNSNNLLAITSNVISEHDPFYPYLWGREHTLSDAISTIAGLNYNTDNHPLGFAFPKEQTIHSINQQIIRKKFLFSDDTTIAVPDGKWSLSIYDISGILVYQQHNLSSTQIHLSDLFLKPNTGVGFLSLVKM